MNELTITEQSELEHHEAVIERGLKTFVDVGASLMAIRDRRLYKQEYDTFDEYCRIRWNIDRTYAHRMIDAAQVHNNLLPIGNILPANEAQARPLARLEATEQFTVWNRIVAQTREDDSPLTAAKIKRAVRDFEREQKGQDKPPPFPTGTFSIIYADPPWSYDNSGFTQSAASQYPTMSTQEIADLPVADLCTPDSVLFLWATSPLLDQAFMVIRSWGFTYKASMVWDKGRAPGIGWFVCTEHEFLLIATRQNNTHPATKPRSIIRESAGRHSEKPESVRAMIETMYPGPYCELFARSAKNGWYGWGNEL